MRATRAALLPAALFTSVLLASCGGGGGDEGSFYCGYIQGSNITSSNAQSACANCDSRNLSDATDSRQNSYAELVTGTGGQQAVTIIDRNGKQTWPAGAKAGMLIALPETAAGNNAITINTFLGDVAEDTATGSMLTVKSTAGATRAPSYLYFTTSRSFDGMSVVINSTSGTTYRVYELCGDGG